MTPIRGRKVAAKARTDQPDVDQEAPKAGDNAMTFEQRRALMLSHVVKLEELIEKRDSAVSAVRNKRKVMKGDGFDAAEIDFMLYLRKTEDQPVKDKLETQIRMLQYLDHPLQHQFDLFAKDEKADPLKAAREAGRIAGAEGKMAKTPSRYGGASEKAWLDGWHEGQEALAKGIKPTEDDRDLRPRHLQEKDPGGSSLGDPDPATLN